MIKVGQIFELAETKKRIVVIRTEQSKSPYSWIDFIFENGYVDRLWKKTVESELRLIATYPTWQQAVNSPEFNGEITNDL